MMKKLFLLLMKYMPIIQMVGMLINNTLYYANDGHTINYIIDFIFGNSVINTFLFYVCSYALGFCKYYRIIIIANFINILIAFTDTLIKIPISDMKLLISYYVIASVFSLIATYIHVKQNKHGKHKIKNH